MNYREAWTFLNNLQLFKIKLGLDSMTRFLGRVGNPQERVPFVHVAGTNGKGSMSAALLTVLARAGYRVGLYTSPHLSSVRERFRINDQFIPESDFAMIATEIRAVLDDRQITYFEFTTALALLWFARQQVDLAILEVGMGGRLDATNVVTPLVGVITNISLDHEAHLGTTLSAVAAEKAGIVKQRVPLVSAVADGPGRPVVEEACRARQAPLFLLGRDFTATRDSGRGWSFSGRTPAWSFTDLPLHLRGSYQVSNLALALASLELLEEHGFRVAEDSVRQGLAEVRWPGRLEYFRQGGRRYLLDGAHNPAGVASLVEALEEEFEYRNLLVIWASMVDKDIGSGLTRIMPLCGRIIFTRPEGERSARPEDLVGYLPAEARRVAMLTDSVAEALDRAAASAGPEDLICVAGSLYLVGAARRLLLGEVV